ncbi:general substrate transporter [Dothidotthia symphoricarpi CBS 119687]|uniref:General substrate transporter n=1 Tax=Dothidotthia symphoricarpi CBS 119687 TaxID=1392245 RepID=A0A6A5ZY02_9PLEO|nr:general substrate transporter [Dothidotthia symphoricarpi CBS 119687]KAF2124652.1 general substrate transporter [Dothidotthia symphoricarpi CBS 119687]
MEKDDTAARVHTTTSDHGDQKGAVAEVRVIAGSEAIAEAKLKEPPTRFSLYAMILYLCAFVGFFCSTCNGFDGSVFNALLLNKAFKSYFKVESSGAWAGIVSSMYQIGGVVAIPFIGPACDTWGRRFGMIIGGAIGCAGVIIQATTKADRGNPIGQFMGGRFLLGFAVPILTTAGPLHVIETAHPAHRGVITGLYNTFWFVGSILAAGVARGSTNLPGNQSWIMPVWMQILFPGLITVLAYFLPESPRWLYTRGRHSDAKKILTKFHGEGNPDSAWVSMQLREYEEYLNMDGGDKRWWDYSALFKTRGARYRIACNVTISIFGQWAGNGAIDYFIGAVLETVGITDEIQGMNINLGKACAQLACAVTGAFFVDKLGRRPMLMGAFGSAAFMWAVAIGCVSENAKTGNAAAGKAFIAFIFLFNCVFAFGITPLQALYPVEVLSFEIRAKGMAFSNLAITTAMLVNQFAYPIALERIKWKLYIVFAVWCPVQALVVWAFIPETKKRTLEELDDIFNAPNPRNASLVKKKIAADSEGNILEVEKV